jgi:hypothetical protein
MALGLGIAVAVLLAASQSGASGGGTVPDGLGALGISATALEPDGYISRDAAISEAVQEGFADEGQVEAYLVRATDANTPLVQSRDVWLLVITGVKFSGGTPIGPDGLAVEPPALYDRLYVYIDAMTGHWILTRAVEATT